MNTKGIDNYFNRASLPFSVEGLRAVGVFLELLFRLQYFISILEAIIAAERSCNEMPNEHNSLTEQYGNEERLFVV